MASTSTRPVATADISILTPVMTLEGHEPWNYSTPDGQYEFKYVESISYFPDGKQMISRSRDKTIRRWDLRKGKEIEKAREVDEYVKAVGLSRDGRWVVIASDKGIKVSEVETGIVRTFHEGDPIESIDISADSTLLAGGSYAVRVWNLDTGKLVAGPFNFGAYIPDSEALRFSEDSRKLAVNRMSYSRERHLQVCDVQTQKLDVQKSIHDAAHSILNVPIFWTTKDKSIVVAFNSADPYGKTSKIYEYEPSTLKTVGAPFNHTSTIWGLALSSDCVLLASSSDNTCIKLWAFESRQLLASFDVESPRTLLLSPDSRQLAYTTWLDAKICICNIPANILANIESVCIPAYIHHLYANKHSYRSAHLNILIYSTYVILPFPSSMPIHFKL
jgi:WD40 repeat protein